MGSWMDGMTLVMLGNDTAVMLGNDTAQISDLA
jgi:hypothetical protein